jgi:tetratricopeptide (TPR) repeat protein
MTSETEATLQSIGEWLECSEAQSPRPGLPVNESLERAACLRAHSDAVSSFELDHLEDSPDVAYALSQLLMEQCAESPRQVLRDASLIHDSLERQRWELDEFSEKEVLLCSFALICWRASRLLNLGRKTQEWFSVHTRHFRSSLDWDAAYHEWRSLDRWQKLGSTDLAILGIERVLHMLLQLQEDTESDPTAVRLRAHAIYECLKGSTAFPSDIQSFFQGEIARLIGSSFRVTGRYSEAHDWLDRAESHYRAGVDSEPQLAVILFLRLTILYGQSQLEPVLKAAPILDRRFARLGMEEYRVKCGILWASSLKISGQIGAALQVLEGFRQASPPIPPRLMGWILAEIGDCYAIRGDDELGIEALERASDLMRREKQLTGLAQVNSMIGGICRGRGLLPEALQLFLTSVRDYEQLGMSVSAAYIRLLIAETYLAMQLPRNAEEEVLRALPVLEEQRVVPDTLVALSILREATRRQKLDPQMLRNLHERFRPSR